MEKRRLYTLCTCILPLMICSGLVYSMFSLYMSEQLKASKTQIGLIYMVGSLVGLLFGPFLGKLADRFGRKPIILGSMASFGLIFVLYATVRGIFIIYPIQLLEGAAWVAIGAATTAYIADIIPQEKRGWAMGVYQQTISVGWMIGPAFGGFLSDVIGSRQTFMLGAILVAIGFVLVLLLVKEPHRRQG
ncbi:MAG: putative multidrug resistance protein [Dehalococcoidales bacterium]|nr:putative multidrug resistance protein [Dehalococcoidales bacterium]